MNELFNTNQAEITQEHSRSNKMLFESKRKRYLNIVSAFALILLCLLVIAVIVRSKIAEPSATVNEPLISSPFSLAVSQQYGFPLYYPHTLPEGYVLDNESIRSEKGILFFAVKNNDKNITISEQAKPSSPPKINNATGNSEVKFINTASGSATLGKVKGAPVGIMQTKTTMINILASSNTPLEDVQEVVENLQKVK